MSFPTLRSCKHLSPRTPATKREKETYRLKLGFSKPIVIDHSEPGSWVQDRAYLWTPSPFEAMIELANSISSKLQTYGYLTPISQTIQEIQASLLIQLWVKCIISVNWITMTWKSGERLRTTGKHWTAVSTLLGLISIVNRNLHHWRSNQQPQLAVPKLYTWAISTYRTQVAPYQYLFCSATRISLVLKADIPLNNGSWTKRKQPRHAGYWREGNHKLRNDVLL